MRSLNPQFDKDLQNGVPVSLDLGSGGRRYPGYYGIDLLPLPGVDVVADLNEPLDVLPDDSVERIRTSHALEHVREFMPLMREIHRVCRPEALIEIAVPHFSNVYGFSDPTHVRFFGLYTMHYFVPQEFQPRIRRVPTFYSDARFIVDSVHIEFYRSGRIDALMGGWITRLVNISINWQDFYERRLAYLYHARQIVYRMRPIKGNKDS